MFKMDPWKRIDREAKPFTLPESIFIFEGTVAQPPNAETKPRQFGADKIKDV